MKKTIKGYILGFISAAVLFSGTVYAANNTTTLYNVLAEGISIVVDGQKINPVDANGNKVEPIIYNGTTYLPVRAIADALGKEVYWDGPNYTVYLGKMNGQLQYPSVELENMKSITNHIAKADTLIDNYGNSYSRATTSWWYKKVEFLLNAKYSRFKGTLYVPEGQKTTAENWFTIVADGKTIYTSPKMNKTSAPVYFDVNITGYNDVVIEFDNKDSWTKTKLELCLGEAGFYQ